VRVAFNHWFAKGYQGVATVRDDTLQGQGNVYTYRAPTCRTEKRALKIAEGIFGNLSRRPRSQWDEPPDLTKEELILSWDEDPELVALRCNQLYETLAQSTLVSK
jgi:hypothetical protein